MLKGHLYYPTIPENRLTKYFFWYKIYIEKYKFQDLIESVEMLYDLNFLLKDNHNYLTTMSNFQNQVYQF